MTSPPLESSPSLPQRMRGLADLLGTARYAEVCSDLLGGAPRTAYLPELRHLTQLGFEPGSPELDPVPWADYWPRSWGARGLLHVWHDSASGAVVSGLGDKHWRPAEMCLKVVARHDVAGAGDAVARLSSAELPRVRMHVCRALAVVGDTEHADVVRRLLDDPDPTVAAAAERALEAMGRRLDLR